MTSDPQSLVHSPRPLGRSVGRVLRTSGVFEGTMLSKRSTDYGRGREIPSDTFVIDGEDAEKRHAHFYCDARGFLALLDNFELLFMEDPEHTRRGSWQWHLRAQRPSACCPDKLKRRYIRLDCRRTSPSERKARLQAVPFQANGSARPRATADRPPPR